MSGKPVALITGGAGGIGLACAQKLAERFQVAIADRDEEMASRAAVATGGTGVQCDVTSDRSVADCLERIERDVGPVSALVTVAGVIQERHFTPEEFVQDEWDRVMDINAKGTWICCRLIGGRMAQRGQGSIVTISSVAGQRSWPTHAYGPSKAAVLQMTRNLAVEWGRSGVRVNSVSPGFTWTKRLQELGRSRGADDDRMIRNTALGRWIAPEEIANAVAFLISDDASAITGIDLPVDAGWLSGINWVGMRADGIPLARSRT